MISLGMGIKAQDRWGKHYLPERPIIKFGFPHINYKNHSNRALGIVQPIQRQFVRIVEAINRGVV